MKLAQRSGEEERKGGKEGGKRKGSPAGKSPDGGKAERRKKKEEEEEEEKKKMEERTEFDEEGLVNDMEPVQSYCSEGWHSVCSFFVKFFEGWWEIMKEKQNSYLMHDAASSQSEKCFFS